MTATTTELKAAYIRRHPLQRVESPSKGFSGVVHVGKIPNMGLYHVLTGSRFLDCGVSTLVSNCKNTYRFSPLKIFAR